MVSPRKKTSKALRREATTPRTWRVHCQFESRRLRISTSAVRKMIAAVLREVESDISLPEVAELNVLFTDDKRMRVINREFRQKDKATDVLSFPQFEPKEIRGTRRPRGIVGTYLGDLVISTETTLRQAREFGVTPRQELLRLIVHGILHLCGYDHEGVPAAQAQAMRRRERHVRSQLAR